jgi:hypothetical protein
MIIQNEEGNLSDARLSFIRSVVSLSVYSSYCHIICNNFGLILKTLGTNDLAIKDIPQI